MSYNSPHGFSWKWGMPPVSLISKFGFEVNVTHPQGYIDLSLTDDLEIEMKTDIKI